MTQTFREKWLEAVRKKNSVYGSNSTPEQQAERAKYYMGILNELRASA